jgi:hypothetical protein
MRGATPQRIRAARSPWTLPSVVGATMKASCAGKTTRHSSTFNKILYWALDRRLEPIAATLRTPSPLGPAISFVTKYHKMNQFVRGLARLTDPFTHLTPEDGHVAAGSLSALACGALHRRKGRCDDS